ncbi:uncharacterized protein LOC114543746 [Dendronephthya gigantea]|uniref:uncharacterized protein LOC114543746 n=1 Tax=Dendronephthya gigantea TaxID=151771 RepID=UPI001069C4C3|nr:uncharacterized protein LOC114543746 [Dendronephthya gigantea]
MDGYRAHGAAIAALRRHANRRLETKFRLPPAEPKSGGSMHGRISSTRGGHRSPAPSREQATGDEISPTSSGTEKRRIDAWTDIEHTGRPSQPCAVTRTGDWRRNFAYLQRNRKAADRCMDGYRAHGAAIAALRRHANRRLETKFRLPPAEPKSGGSMHGRISSTRGGHRSPAPSQTVRKCLA